MEIFSCVQVHINNAGDWTGPLHARFCASMQLTRSDKGVLMQSLTDSLKQRQGAKEGNAPEQRPAMTTCSKQAGPILHTLYGSAIDCVGLQIFRNFLLSPDPVKNMANSG